MAISEFRKAYNAAPNYVLTGQSNGHTLYIKNKKFVGDSDFSQNIAEAVKFKVGYDDERMKSAAWSISTRINFTVQYLD